MAKFNTPYAKKFISLFLSALLLIQANMPVFASGGSAALMSSAEARDASNKIDNAFLSGEYSNPYENALNFQKNAAIKKINNSSEKTKLASLKNAGKSKYGVLWPMYIEAVGQKYVKNLEEKVKQGLGEILTEPVAMPYKNFQKEYLQQLRKYAKERVSEKGYEVKPPFKTPEENAYQDLLAAFPAKQAYQEYLKDAKDEIAWRKQNKAKVEEAAYQVARAGVQAIGAENLSFNFAGVLLGITLNGKKSITQNEITAMYNYHITRLEKQQFDAFDFGMLSGEKQKKVAATLLVNIIRSISMGAQLNPKSGAERYPKAVESLIYRSQDTSAFSQVLGAGFAALLAKGHYTALDRILSHYTKLEQDSTFWGDWLTLVHYVNLFNGEKYLGPVSVRTQYNTDYIYANTFTDIALLLAENGSAQSKNLLQKYATNRSIATVIKPFLKGALTAKNSGIAQQTAQAKAAELANMDFGDITATYEYDIDFQLLQKYPGISGKLTKNAITTKERKQAKSSHQKAFGYLQRAAQAGDIYLMIYGLIGLAKLSKGAISLSKSTYTAIRASRIQNMGQRIAYIRANYGQMSKYISAKRSFMRLSTNIKIFFDQPINPRTVFKLESAENAKKLADMEKAAAKAKEVAQQTGKAKDIAKANLAEAQFHLEQSRIGVGLELRKDGAQSLLRKFQAYQSGELGNLASLTPAETNFVKSLYIYRTNMQTAAQAAAEYYPHLNIFQRGFYYTYGKLSYWFTKFNPRYWSFRVDGSVYSAGAKASSGVTTTAVSANGPVFAAPELPSSSLSVKPDFSVPQTLNKPSLLPPQTYSLKPYSIDFLRNVNKQVAIPVAFTMLFNPFHAPAEAKFFDPLLSSSKANSIEATIIPTPIGTYEGEVTDLFNKQIEASQNVLFEHEGSNINIPQMIELIEAKHPESGITLARYNKDIEALRKIAPQLTPATFDRLLKSLSNGDLLKRILGSKSKKAEKKLLELFAKYKNSLNYFEAYNRAITSSPFPTNLVLPRGFFNVVEFPAVEGFNPAAVEQSVEALDEIEFSKRLVKSLFSSRNLISSLQDLLSAADANKALQMSSKMTKLHYQIDDLLKGGIPKKSIKGCIIDEGAAWDRNVDMATFSPDRLGLSVEFQFDAGRDIVDWIHKNNIPYDPKSYISARKKGFLPESVLENITSWAKSKIGISEEHPAHYVEFFTEDGVKEVHVYNSDYTARIRLGKHELSPGNPHLHFEYLEHGAWDGIKNHSYAFDVEDAYLPQIQVLLQNLQQYFRPRPKMDANAILGRNPPENQKVLYILGGPNASGKTRLFNALFSDQKLPFLNSDIVAAEKNISDVEAGRLVLAQMDDMFKEGKSFIFESTLSGRGVSAYIKRAKENDYKVMILYIFVKDPGTSIARAQSRLLEGGHGVPYGDLTQRYVKSRNNFWNLYKDMADDWIMFFNGDTDIVPIASQKEGSALQILEKDIFSAQQPLDPETGKSIVDILPK